MSQDLEVAAEFQLCQSISTSELMSKLADTGHVKVSLSVTLSALFTLIAWCIIFL